MEAVKLSGAAQVKSQIRIASPDAPKGGDEFMKLLQAKKEQVQPEKADVKQTDGRDAKKEDEKAPKVQDEKDDSSEEEVSSRDGAEPEALLQAAMQQTAAQMAGIVTEEPREEPVKAEVAAPVETVSVEETVQPETAAETAAGQPVETAWQAGRPKEQESGAPADGGEEQSADSGFKALGGEKAPEREPEVSPYKSQAQEGPQERVPAQEKTDSKESVYGAAAARTETQPGFAAPKSEEVPLKTSQDTLPQDLGRTLADRFPGNGRELTVELEPANLGRLTIKMVYEAGRAAVSIIASNPRTLEMLNQRAAEIASILEEKTGQETIIYTQAPQQESKEENPNQNHGGQGQNQSQGEGRQADEGGRHEAESFAQQLRLGLV